MTRCLFGSLHHTLNPRVLGDQVWQATTHFFNHQTHQRGPATTLLKRAGVDIGVTDLIALL